MNEKLVMNKFEIFLESIEDDSNMELLDIIYEGYQAIFEGATLDEIYDKYYSNFDKDEFMEINKSDPTSKGGKRKGKFLPWLLNLRKAGNLKLEDLYKANEYLEIFSKYRQKLKENDIMKINSLSELFDIVKPAIENKESDELKSKKALEKEIKENESEKIYENDEVLILVPKTHRAACLYGSNTQWCTASKDSDRYFNQYSSEGPLYIVIDKVNNEKYQFHAESEQYMDENDSEIEDLPDVLYDNPEALKKIAHVVIDFIEGSDIVDEEVIVNAASKNLKNLVNYKSYIPDDQMNTILSKHTKSNDKFVDMYYDKSTSTIYGIIEKQGNDTLTDMLHAHELLEYSEDALFDVFLHSNTLKYSDIELSELTEDARKEILSAFNTLYSGKEIPKKLSELENDFPELYGALNSIYDYFMAGQTSDQAMRDTIKAMIDSDGIYSLGIMNGEYVILADIEELINDEDSYDYDGELRINPKISVDYEYIFDRILVDPDLDYYSELIIEGLDDAIAHYV